MFYVVGLINLISGPFVFCNRKFSFVNGFSYSEMYLTLYSFGSNCEQPAERHYLCVCGFVFVFDCCSFVCFRSTL